MEKKIMVKDTKEATTEVKKRIIEEYPLKNRSILEYEKDFQKGVSKYIRQIEIEKIYSIAKNSEIIYIGDFHGCSNYQKGALDIISNSSNKKKRRTVFCEFIDSKYQLALDAFLEGFVSEEDMIKNTHMSGWFYDINKYLDILRYSKNERINVVLLNHLRGGLKKRDNYAKKRIFETSDEHSQSFVLFGELHLAKDKLPGLVSEKFEIELQRKPKDIIIYQNCDELYYKLLKSKVNPINKAVQISDNEFCIFNTNPLRKWKMLEDYLDEKCPITNHL